VDGKTSLQQNPPVLNPGASLRALVMASYVTAR